MNQPHLLTVWNKILASPLFGLTLTLIAFQIAMAIFVRGRRHPLLNPILIAAAIVCTVLVASDIHYEQYMNGARMIQFLLGPATVAMAVPLYLHMATLKKMLVPVLVGIGGGVVIATSSAWFIGKALGASTVTLLSLSPKSVTTPIAMGIAEKIGGLPSLAAAIVIVTGIVGAVCGPTLFKLMGITDPSVKGIAIGVGAHGIGTARAFQLNEEMGAFAGLAMAMAGLPTAVFIPVLLAATGVH